MTDRNIVSIAAVKIMMGVGAVLATLSTLPMGSAKASAPVQAEISGCVEHGRLIGGRREGDRYTIRPYRPNERQPIDLHAFEGQRLRFTGQLFPGDRFLVEHGPIPLGPCR